MTVDNLDEYATSLLDVRSKVAYLKGYEKGLAKGQELAVKHAHWINNGKYNSWHVDCTCSECGWNNRKVICHSTYGEVLYYPTGSYCPNCGAMMDGDSNETD